MAKAMNLEGQRFGRWTVLRKAGNHPAFGYSLWLCRCPCGTERIIQIGNLRGGKTTQCRRCSNRGQKPPNFKHGLSKTRLYNIYSASIQCCENPKSKRFKFYGAHGIKFCPQWRTDFKTFYNWAMQSGYNENLVLSRKDTSKDFSPENCIWITRFEAMNKKRNCRLITINGHTQSISGWARIVGISREAMRLRVLVLSNRPKHTLLFPAAPGRRL